MSRFYITGKSGEWTGLRWFYQHVRLVGAGLEDELIIYPATGEEKAVIYVATDINCPYCRVMHQDMDKLNAKGVTVKVIAYPYYEGSPEQMRQIWCETDKDARRQAFDKAMAGEPVATRCTDPSVNPLKANHIKAAGLAVFATPAIYREDGVLFNAPYKDPGFLPFLGLK